MQGVYLSMGERTVNVILLVSNNVAEREKEMGRERERERKKRRDSGRGGERKGRGREEMERVLKGRDTE